MTATYEQLASVHKSPEIARRCPICAQARAEQEQKEQADRLAHKADEKVRQFLHVRAEAKEAM